ncbi:uncharacterized protein TNCV_2475781 [Trichonephila clavipes]|nr:uncharacterized protein TNCV_2475781 [Trichonephila clavipes]
MVDFHKRILFSDEAHFWLNGYVSKQNCRIWSEANPQVYVKTPLHPENLTVWCALWVGGIIGPYFFKNDEGHNVTVNGDRYRAMITNFFIPELNHHDVQELWFQQDGVTCHTARATIDLLKDTFGDRLISCFGPVNWPPRTCDLTPLDYFLWGYVKSLVYADKPQTLDYLEDNICRVIADIRPQMFEKVIENWTPRLDYIQASRGSPMPEVIFKIVTFSRGVNSHLPIHNRFYGFTNWSRTRTTPIDCPWIVVINQLGSDQCTWPWGHFLLSELREWRRQTGRHNGLRAPLTIGKAYLKIIMSSFLGFCEWNTRNRWRDGQVCPDVDKELWRLGPDSSGFFLRRRGDREKKKERTRKRREKSSKKRRADRWRKRRGEENPRALLGDADQESETRMRKNALRTERRQAVE